MVQIDSTFGDGGPPFCGYKNGTGFGGVCRSYINDPTVRTNGKHSPDGAGYYRENRLVVADDVNDDECYCLAEYRDPLLIYY